MKNERQRSLLIVHHTHWDREWYRCFSDFRFRLLRAAEHLTKLLDKGLDRFLFDGQTIAIDDLFDCAEPVLIEKLKEAISGGRIEIGPWYVMPDEFLAHGESLIRNLEIGISSARELGSDPEVLYLPDTFGHISQLPQLARLFHLGTILVARGVNQTRSDLMWKGADGSRIPLHALPLWSGYYQDFLHGDDYIEKCRSFIRENLSYAGGGPLVLTAGSDHVMPPADWEERKALLSRELADWEGGWTVLEAGIQQAMEQRLDAQPPAERPELQGELRDNGKSYLLSGTLSSRVDLKLRNVEAQNALLLELEPMSMFAPEEYLYPRHRRELWKMLLQNHAHDSIGGCSIDQVHRENMVRFDSVCSAAGRQSQDLRRVISGWAPGTFLSKLFVFNTQPRSIRRVHHCSIEVPAEEDLGSVQLYNQGEPVEMEILSRSESQGFYSEFEAPVGWLPSFSYELECDLAMDPMEHRELEIRPCRASINERLPETDEEICLENGEIAFRMDGDQGVLYEVGASGRAIEDLFSFVWERDLGDSYTSSPRADTRCVGQLIKKRMLYRGALSSKAELVYLGEGGSTLTVYPEVRRQESFCRFSFLLENRCEDTRVRMLCGRRGGKLSSSADIPFDIVERSHKPGQGQKAEPQRELYPNEWPSSSFVAAAGLSLYHRGLHGYDLEADGRLALNLLRSLGQLSRGYLPERGGGAGPHMSTPEAQLPGPISSEFALGFQEASLRPMVSRLFQSSFYAQQGLEYSGRSPRLEIDDPRVLVQACYRISDREFCLRLLNTTSEKRCPRLRVEPGSRMDAVDLLGNKMETDIKQIDNDASCFSLPMRRKELVSLSIREGRD